MHDTLIRNGTVIDGTGAPAFISDVALTNGRIGAIGKDLGMAHEIIDADGLLVTPGFVDIHTHLDGQAMWDPILAPLISHGVTTAVLGNCGVGFAPAAPHHRDFLLDLMSGVEDIPRAALEKGIDWTWHTFPEYLRALDAKPHVIDLGALVPYGPLRVDALGIERSGFADITDEEAARLTALVQQAITSGALGVAMSRTRLHVSLDGNVVPGTSANEAEVRSIARAIRNAGGGVLELAPSNVMGEDSAGMPPEMQWLPDVSKSSGIAVTISVVQHLTDLQAYAKSLAQCAMANRHGAKMRPQITGRPTVGMMSFEGWNPFRMLSSFAQLRELDSDRRLTLLRSPEVRAKLLSERTPHSEGIELMFAEPDWGKVFRMTQPLNYFPNADDSLATIAQKANGDPRAVAYDAMLENDGTSFLMYLLNNFDNEAAHRMLTDENAVWGLGDAGAHATIVSDCSFPTLALTYWVRDRDKEDPRRLSIEYTIRKLSNDNALLFGLLDRGVLAPGKKADVNLLDLEKLTLHTPRMFYDLPLGMPRVIQGGEGFEATFVSGRLVQRHGVLTGIHPGRVARASHLN